VSGSVRCGGATVAGGIGPPDPVIGGDTHGDGAQVGGEGGVHGFSVVGTHPGGVHGFSVVGTHCGGVHGFCGVATHGGTQGLSAVGMHFSGGATWQRLWAGLPRAMPWLVSHS